MTPYEIIAAPFELWWAPVGTAFPAINAAPSSPWAKVGTSGKNNYTDAGVRVSHAQTIDQFRFHGGTGPRKAVRSEESLTVMVTMADISLEHYRLALNNVTVATSATPDRKTATLYKGAQVAVMALLVRGPSPYDEALSLQYQIPRCFEGGSPEIAYVKNAPAAIELQFVALEDLAAATDADRFGSLVAAYTP